MSYPSDMNGLELFTAPFGRPQSVKTKAPASRPQQIKATAPQQAKAGRPIAENCSTACKAGGFGNSATAC